MKTIMMFIAAGIFASWLGQGMEEVIQIAAIEISVQAIEE